MNSFDSRPRNDPFSNTYNQGWRNHPNFSWRDNQGTENQWGNNNNYGQRQYNDGTQQNPISQPTNLSIEDTLKQFIQTIDQRMNHHDKRFQDSDVRRHNFDALLRNIETQIGQLAEANQRNEPGRFPSHTEQAKAITTQWKGKDLNNNKPAELFNAAINVSGFSEKNSELGEKEELKVEKSKDTSKIHKSPIPFPSRVQKNKLNQSFKEIYNILSNDNVRLQTMEEIHKMPAYIKYFKELNSRSRKTDSHETVPIPDGASAIPQKKLPPKLKDPGSFNITITVGEIRKERAILDLGASILMPYTVYKEMGLSNLKPINMELSLTDRSIRYPRGIVKDVLVQVDKLIIPAYFIILDMEEEGTNIIDFPILLVGITDCFNVEVVDPGVFPESNSALKESRNGKRSKISHCARYENMIEQLKEDKQMIVALNSELTTKITGLLEEKESSLQRYAILSHEVEKLKEEFDHRMKLMKADIEQRDKSLEIMKIKELEDIANLKRAEQEIKSMVMDEKKQLEEVKINKMKFENNLVPASLARPLSRHMSRPWYTTHEGSAN
ncbi:hypothetical protein Ddye_020434 [Dipteronia dyeriana]|uniref:Uncharacterized protein n=1 Tax=Dipteronia dyeriana TaxID=168575 RepID=A0AAD9WVD1_9ROSI|nr:hypothetical protein Ddye_020434 [Dipteronia dyeriana]